MEGTLTVETVREAAGMSIILYSKELVLNYRFSLMILGWFFHHYPNDPLTFASDRLAVRGL